MSQTHRTMLMPTLFKIYGFWRNGLDIDFSVWDDRHVRDWGKCGLIGAPISSEKSSSGQRIQTFGFSTQ
jgi:hypothetical protein